jgi:hypothetical protein
MPRRTRTKLISQKKVRAGGGEGRPKGLSETGADVQREIAGGAV